MMSLINTERKFSNLFIMGLWFWLSWIHIQEILLYTNQDAEKVVERYFFPGGKVMGNEKKGGG